MGVERQGHDRWQLALPTREFAARHRASASWQWQRSKAGTTRPGRAATSIVVMFMPALQHRPTGLFYVDLGGGMNINPKP